MAADTEVEPFDATVNGAWSLVPEAKLADVPIGDPLPTGSYAVRVAQVEAWVNELTGVVAMELDGWQRLSDVPLAPETTSDRDQLVEAARTVIHNGAASYLEAARFPERATPNADTSYAAVLWARYETGLTRIAAWLKTRLAAADPADTEPVTGPGIAFTFPPPLVGDVLYR